jgi:hypothetical protein
MGTKSLAADEGSSPLRVSVESTLAYTDNRDSSETNTESTLDLFVKPRISMGIDARQTVVDFHVTPGIRYRTNPSPTDNEFQWLLDAGVDLQQNFTPNLKMRVKEQLDYTDDPSVQDGGKVVRGNQSYLLNRAEAGVNWKFLPLWALDAYSRYSTKMYSQSKVADVANEDRLEVGTMLWRQVARQVGVKAIGRYEAFSLAPLGSVSRDFTVLVGALGTEIGITPTLRGGATVGFNAANYSDPDVSSMNGPYAELTLLGKITPVLSLQGAVTHAIREADSQNYISQEYTEANVKAEWLASSEVALGFGGAVRYGEYERQIAAKSGDETAVTVLGDVAFKVMPKGTIKLSQKYEDVSSDVTSPYTKNTSAISFVATF